MSTTLTIRNLDATVKHKLRQQAALHQRSMEAEAREILAAGLTKGADVSPEAAMAERRKRIAGVLGIWKKRYDGKSTDEMMKELRGNE